MNRKFATIFLLLLLALAATAQTKSKKPVKKPVKKPAAVKAQPASADTEVPVSTKKNERPLEPATPVELKKTSRPAIEPKVPVKAVYPYFYEFTQPAFVINRLTIEHDDTGKGIVTFTKRDMEEAFTDPIQLSPVTMQKLKSGWEALNFLDSTENYQSAERQYAHLGSMKLRLRRDKRERLAEFNWSENKDAKALVDEYRNLGQQFVWIFDITVARQNQPLESPKLMESFESMLRRKEISDPQEMVPFLTGLSEDERIPLMARNHATRLIKQIEKDKK
jgi:hypothetical protein